MSIQIIQQRLDTYQSQSKLEENNALKEITQEIALMALSKANFFKVAEFHGGTALRILYGIPRFSEDLDFALLTPNTQFALNDYLKHMEEEFRAYGYSIHISDRSEVKKTVQKQFLKVDSIGKLLSLQYPDIKSDRKIKIKFEIDTNPPSGAITEIKYLTFPLPFTVVAKDLSSSFSGKLHALLCRMFNKGRDWYDFIWYINNQTPINYGLLENALNQQGPWQNQNIVLSREWLVAALTRKIQSIHWEELKEDISPFLKPHDRLGLKLWSQELFLSLLARM